MKYKSKNILVLVLIVLCLIILSAFSSIFYDHVVIKAITEPFNINERTITWLSGLSMFYNNIISGVGIGQSPLVISMYIPEELKIFDNLLFYDTYRQPPMNTFIEWAAETGAVGLALLALVIVRMYKHGKSKINSGDSKFIYFACGGGLVALLISFNSSSGNIYSGFFTLIISLYLAGFNLYISSENNNSEEYHTL